MRMTFDFKDNEQKMNRHAAEVIGQIARAMNPSKESPRARCVMARARTREWLARRA